jgi:RHS repeat-associated protein
LTKFRCAIITNLSEKKVYYNNLTVHHQRGNIRQINDYYPYGLTWSNPSTTNTQAYQSKEMQLGEWGENGGLELYDFHARMYDPVLGRWHAPDPMNQYDSPYTAMGNNPVTTIDPDGMLGIPWGGIISTLGNIFIPDVMVRIGGTAKGGPGPTYVSQQSPLGQAVDAIGGAVAFGLGNEILDEGKEKIASEASNVAAVSAQQSTKNVMIVILDASNQDFAASDNSQMGSFHIITASDITEANDKLTEYLGDDKANTIALFTHGFAVKSESGVKRGISTNPSIGHGIRKTRNYSKWCLLFIQIRKKSRRFCQS